MGASFSFSVIWSLYSATRGQAIPSVIGRYLSAATFKGLAIGDAIGKQTESLKFEEIKEWFPEGISGLHGAINTVMPRYDGKHYLWRFGETTDDTEQSISIARVIANGTPLSHSFS
ncbi:ADP-ribosylglycohydrolase family protein [Paenibacillus konkukensis]|uniref:ADP-ribosylglycohydrolase family protein n=1 Tax=Paenibacillus konkukensis TaxID=2020716 RepID=UPI00201DA247|nr:ADP-ribosylglycohydrolase family protein [Paenibacillus konkukensis]